MFGAFLVECPTDSLGTSVELPIPGGLTILPTAGRMISRIFGTKYALIVRLNTVSCFILQRINAPLHAGTHQSLKGNARATATVTGIIDGTGSIGAALQGVLIPLIREVGYDPKDPDRGWNYVFYFLILCCLLSALLLSGAYVMCYS